MKKSIFLFFIFLTVAIPPFLSAESRDVIINEIAWMGTPIAGVEERQWWRYEWLELYNTGDTVGMLDGWTVELSREKIDFKIPLSGTIASQGYFLIGASDKIPNLDLNYKNLGGKFFNGGQRVVLKNGLGEIIDEVDARSGWPTGDNKTKQTMERKARTVLATWQASVSPGGTPKAPNSAGVASQTKSDLVKNEETEKDPPAGEAGLLGSSQVELNSIKFQSRVPVVSPITLLAGFLALGFSGVLLLVKRSLVLRQKRQRV